MAGTDPRVDLYIERAGPWKDSAAELRRILLDSGLVEAFKWRQPCYVAEGGNIAIIQSFKEHCSLMFFKGALLDDPENVLRPGPNSQAARRIEFTDAAQVTRLRGVIEKYVTQAVEAERAGLEVEFDREPEPRPDELEAKFSEDPEFKRAFEALTPGRQRAYILHFSGARRSGTRVSRIEKCIPRIMEGRGLNDR